MHSFARSLRAPRPLPLVICVALSPLTLVAACSPGSDVVGDEGQGGQAASATGSGASGSTGGASSGGDGGGEPLFDAGPPDGLTPDTACAYITQKANATPLNLYIMFDKSQSMVGDKWDSAKAGLATFVKAPESEGIRVALRFFPRPPDDTPACDQNAYKTPTVPFGELPGNAQAIIDAIEAETPNGFTTPTYPALGGAILGAYEAAAGKSGEAAAVLLVTDGEPQGPADKCSGVDPKDPQVIAELAATGAGLKPPVTTYVIGLPGVSQAFANQVAAAGGSDKAILVSNVNVQAQFAEALQEVLGSALPCEYVLSEEVVKGEVEPNKVNVQVTTNSGGPPESYDVPQNPDCDGKGWYYDKPESPSLIILCPETCAELKADYKAKIEILLGCETKIAK